MTNLEKWKVDLTVDAFIDIMESLTYNGCEPCILELDGNNERKYCKCMLIPDNEEINCRKFLANWANAEVEDII